MRVSSEISEIIVDPGAYADWEKSHAAYTELRKTAPLAVAQPEGYDPFWVVTKFDDIKHIERSSDIFLNNPRSVGLVTKSADEETRSKTGGSPHMFTTIVQMDNPDHFKYRHLTQAWFMPKNLKKLDDDIRAVAKEFIDPFLQSGGAADFAKEVAFLFPLRIIMKILGVPKEDQPLMLKLTQELFGSNDPELNRDGKIPTPEELVALRQQAVLEFFTYFNELVADRRANPTDDLASTIANGEIDGQQIGSMAAVAYYLVAATAGHDTTSASNASAMWALAERPDQFQKVKSNPDLIKGLVEESIRWESPIKHFCRTAGEDTELRGQKIAKGDWLMLAYPSGNRDEEQFDQPFEFNVERFENVPRTELKHVAFGYGAHNCLGQHLARLESEILWQELLPQLKSVELTGTPTRARAAFVTGPKTVPVKFELE